MLCCASASNSASRHCVNFFQMMYVCYIFISSVSWLWLLDLRPWLWVMCIWAFAPRCWWRDASWSFMCCWVREDHHTTQKHTKTTIFQRMLQQSHSSNHEFSLMSSGHSNHQSCFKLASVCGVAGLDLRSDRTAPLVDTICDILRICCNLVGQDLLGKDGPIFIGNSKNPDAWCTFVLEWRV